MDAWILGGLRGLALGLVMAGYVLFALFLSSWQGTVGGRSFLGLSIVVLMVIVAAPLCVLERWIARREPATVAQVLWALFGGLCAFLFLSIGGAQTAYCFGVSEGGFAKGMEAALNYFTLWWPTAPMLILQATFAAPFAAALFWRLREWSLGWELAFGTVGLVVLVLIVGVLFQREGRQHLTWAISTRLALGLLLGLPWIALPLVYRGMGRLSDRLLARLRPSP